MKPILACDVDLDKLEYPVAAMFKIDGVRALNVDGRLVGRSGKQFKNRLNTEFFSDPRFEGFDGEMVIDRITGCGICNETTSAMGTIKGTIETRWCLFDYFAEEDYDSPYALRYKRLSQKLEQLYQEDPSLASRLWLIPSRTLYSRDDVDAMEIESIQEGYEGLILRDLHAPYKFGRSTVKEGYYLRLKRFMDSEVMVTDVKEGRSNQNELTANPHGYAERSTLAAGMVPNGMVGTIVGLALHDVTFNNRIIITKGSEVEIAPGKMSHADRRYYFDNQDEIIGKMVKYQFFPTGVKDKPRFPTFQGFRDPVDL